MNKPQCGCASSYRLPRTWRRADGTRVCSRCLLTRGSQPRHAERREDARDRADYERLTDFCYGDE